MSKPILRLTGGPGPGTFKLVDNETGKDYSNTILSAHLNIYPHQVEVEFRAVVVVDIGVSLDDVKIDPEVFFQYKSGEG